jgi:hypothetical protein
VAAAQRLESHAQQGRVDQAAALLESLERELSRVRNALDQMPDTELVPS